MYVVTLATQILSLKMAITDYERELKHAKATNNAEAIDWASGQIANFTKTLELLRALEAQAQAAQAVAAIVNAK